MRSFNIIKPLVMFRYSTFSYFIKQRSPTLCIYDLKFFSFLSIFQRSCIILLFSQLLIIFLPLDIEYLPYISKEFIQILDITSLSTYDTLNYILVSAYIILIFLIIIYNKINILGHLINIATLIFENLVKIISALLILGIYIIN